MCVAVLAVALFSPAALAAPWWDVQVSYSQLPDENWEYVYDFYGTGGEWLVNMFLEGIDDTSAIVNQYPFGWGGVSGTMVQKWDYHCANNPPSWNYTAYGSYSTDGATWSLHGEAWAIDNPWHAPGEYAGIPGNWCSFEKPQFVYPGQVDARGPGTLQFQARGVGGGALNGLLLTFRLVHPNAPVADAISWGVYTYVGQNDVGTVAGPGAAGVVPGDYDDDGDVDPDDVDELCANIGSTDPGLLDVMDLDDDGDIDVDDQVIHVTTLLEYDLDGDDVADGQGTFVADFNTDGTVDLADLTTMRTNSGQTGMGFADGDTNCDGAVDLADLTTLRGLSGSSVSGVPEPVTLGLLSLGGVALLRRRK